eukprot:2564839-Rhodomonas_salina.2
MSTTQYGSHLPNVSVFGRCRHPLIFTRRLNGGRHQISPCAADQEQQQRQSLHHRRQLCEHR